MQTKLSKEQIGLFLDAYNCRHATGESVQNIAKRFNILPTSASRIARRAGLTKGITKLTDDDKIEVIRLYELGDTVKKLTEIFSVTKTTISDVLKIAGINVKIGRPRDLAKQLKPNMRFKNLTTVSLYNEKARSGHSESLWNCQCDCGNLKVVRSDRLVNQSTQSCGCLGKVVRAVTLGKKAKVRAEKYIGIDFGWLTVTEYVGTIKGITVIKCRCKCGTIKEFKLHTLLWGHTKSCGCWAKSDEYKMLIRLPDGVAAFNVLLCRYKQQARQRKLDFTLTDIEAKELFTSSCFYCGVIPSQVQKSYVSSFIYNGIDRLNNKLGYIMSNCVACCGECNQAKSDRDFNQFKSWITKVSQCINSIRQVA